MEEQKIQRIGSSKRRVPQQISVPFLWEEKPGRARSQWPLPPQPDLLLLMPAQPQPASAIVPSRPPPPPPPAQFVVSVPFKWEEKPGTPIRTFTRDPSVVAPKSKNLPLPPSYYSQFFECFDSDEESSFEDEDESPDWLTELDQDASSSGPSLLAANGLVRASAISSAIPFDDVDDDSSDIDSYETGSTSPVGNAFLEQLFPRYTPNPNSPPPTIKRKAAAPRRSKGIAWSRELSVVFRRPQTLGDLIMLSRRRSYMHKAAALDDNLSKEFENPGAIGCCLFGSGKGGIAKFLGGKTLLSLKFV